MRVRNTYKTKRSKVTVDVVNVVSEFDGFIPRYKYLSFHWYFALEHEK